MEDFDATGTGGRTRPKGWKDEQDEAQICIRTNAEGRPVVYAVVGGKEYSIPKVFSVDLDEMTGASRHITATVRLVIDKLG